MTDAITDTLNTIRDRVLTDARQQRWHDGYRVGAHDIARLVVDNLNRRVEGPDPAPEDTALRDHFVVLLAHWLRPPQ